MTARPPVAGQLLYSPTEAARMLSVGRSTVYELMAAGALKYVKQGSIRRLRRRDLEAYVDALNVQTN